MPPQLVGEEYPEVEKCYPYNPSGRLFIECTNTTLLSVDPRLTHVFEPSSDFEDYSVPEEVCLSRLSLAGLGTLQGPLASTEDDFKMDPCLKLSPLKMPTGILTVLLKS